MENKDDILNNLLCMACLCVGRSIHELRDEKSKKYYLDILNEIPVRYIQFFFKTIVKVMFDIKIIKIVILY